MNKTFLIIFIVIIAIGLIVIKLKEVGSDAKENRQPNSQSGGQSFEQARVHQHIGCKVWKTKTKELFYAISMGYGSFEPMLPSFNFTYSYDTEKGGSLFINGKPILYSNEKRLLALNSFGKMEEIALSNSEEQIVTAGDAVNIWNKIVLKRLYKFKGEKKTKKRIGLWTCFDSIGRKSYEGNYVNGKRNGTWSYYYASGIIRAKINYTDGIRNGKWTFFTEEGKVNGSSIWKNNFPTKKPAIQTGLGHKYILYPNGNSHSESH